MTARVAWSPRFHNPQLAKWLHRLDVPALVVWGDDDIIFPSRQADVFADAIPGAQMLVIDDTGHLPHVEAPVAFAGGVAAFLDGVEP
jgi:pimeloyl-ACP methyl ester carboxylesterase